METTKEKLKQILEIYEDDGNVPLHLTKSQKRYLRNPQSYYKTKFNYGKRKRRNNQTVQTEV
jgi:hypothetical protein